MAAERNLGALTPVPVDTVGIRDRQTWRLETHGQNDNQDEVRTDKSTTAKSHTGRYRIVCLCCNLDRSTYFSITHKAHRPYSLRAELHTGSLLKAGPV